MHCVRGSSASASSCAKAGRATVTSRPRRVAVFLQMVQMPAKCHGEQMTTMARHCKAPHSENELRRLKQCFNGNWRSPSNAPKSMRHFNCSSSIRWIPCSISTLFKASIVAVRCCKDVFLLVFILAVVGIAIAAQSNMVSCARSERR